MNLVTVKTKQELADYVAQLSVDTLKSALSEFGEASWVLAGGATPVQAYEVIASNFINYLNWRKIWFLVGDERHVPTSDSDSNWGTVEAFLLNKLAARADHKVVPVYNEDVKLMASSYAEALASLPKADNGLPRLDLVWLGIGEDGHTLSLFPGHNLQTSDLAHAVTDSPKPPKERLTLTLSALSQSKNCIILAFGEDKADAVAGLVDRNLSLPIAQAAKVIEGNGGKVHLIVDEAAKNKISG